MPIIDCASSVLDRAAQEFTILHGLTYLELDVCLLPACHLISVFLGSALKLEVFVVTIRPEVNHIEGWSWKSPRTLLTSLSRLEEFEIQGAEKIKHEHSF